MYDYYIYCFKIGNLGIPLSAGRTDYELQKSCFGFSYLGLFSILEFQLDHRAYGTPKLYDKTCPTWVTLFEAALKHIMNSNNTK